MALNALIGKDNLSQQRNFPDNDAIAKWESIKKIGSKTISPKLLPQDIAFIGIRDFEKEEQAMVDEFNLKVYSAQNVKSLGIDMVLQEVLNYLGHCDFIYVSFDVDAQDTSISSGTGTPVDGGLEISESEIIFNTLFNHPKVICFEISEINPLLDCENKMAKSVVHLLQNVM
jgi:arginase